MVIFYTAVLVGSEFDLSSFTSADGYLVPLKQHSSTNETNFEPDAVAKGIG